MPAAASLQARLQDSHPGHQGKNAKQRCGKLKEGQGGSARLLTHAALLCFFTPLCVLRYMGEKYDALQGVGRTGICSKNRCMEESRK